MKWPARVLFVGAHCDDIELLAGGTLHALATRDAGRDASVGLLVFSDHGGVVSPAAARQAQAEWRANVGWLRGRATCALVDHSPGGDAPAHSRWLPACQGHFQSERAGLYAALESLRARYDAVVTHPLTDTNQDHQQVATEVARVFKGHGSALGGEFPANDLGDFRAQVYVPLSEADVAAKVALVQRYDSQRFGGRPYFDAAGLRGLAAARGAQVRAPFAEAFAVLSRVVVAP